MEIETMKVLDLFSGIGGFSLGLEAAGMETVAFSEIEEFPIQVLKKHWPQIPNLGDITKLTKENIYERVGKIDVICGGFPCQSVSIAGRKAGFEDRKKSGLWYEYKRLIEEIKPKFVIIENVRNLLNIGFAEVLKDLSDIGYDAEWEVISARSIGARHLRERIWIVAYPNKNGRVERISSKPDHKKENLLTFVVSQEQQDGAMANPHVPRLWPTFATEEEARRWWAEATACISNRFKTEPCFCRMSYGLRTWMDFYLGDNYSEETKGTLEKIMSCLWSGDDSEEIRIEIGGFREVFETKNMLGILWKHKRISETELSNEEGEKIKKELLRDLRKIREVTCASQGQRPDEQLDREYPDSMLFLPQEASLARGQGPWIEEAMENEKTRKNRVKSLGNSIVPQIAYLIGKRIMEVEKDFR